MHYPAYGDQNSYWYVKGELAAGLNVDMDQLFDSCIVMHHTESCFAVEDLAEEEAEMGTSKDTAQGHSLVSVDNHPKKLVEVPGYIPAAEDTDTLPADNLHVVVGSLAEEEELQDIRS